MCQLKEAKEYYEKSLSIQSKTLAPTHPDKAASLMNLGNVLRQMGKIIEAEKRYKEALDIKIGKFGERHQLTAACYNNLGLLYF